MEKKITGLAQGKEGNREKIRLDAEVGSKKPRKRMVHPDEEIACAEIDDWKL